MTDYTVSLQQSQDAGAYLETHFAILNYAHAEIELSLNGDAVFKTHRGLDVVDATNVEYVVHLGSASEASVTFADEVSASLRPSAVTSMANYQREWNAILSPSDSTPSDSTPSDSTPSDSTPEVKTDALWTKCAYIAFHNIVAETRDVDQSSLDAMFGPNSVDTLGSDELVQAIRAVFASSAGDGTDDTAADTAAADTAAADTAAADTIIESIRAQYIAAHGSDSTSTENILKDGDRIIFHFEKLIEPTESHINSILLKSAVVVHVRNSGEFAPDLSRGLVFRVVPKDGFIDLPYYSDECIDVNYTFSRVFDANATVISGSGTSISGLDTSDMYQVSMTFPDDTDPVSIGVTFAHSNLKENESVVITEWNQIHLSPKGGQFKLFKGEFQTPENDTPTLIEPTSLAFAFYGSTFNNDILSNWNLTNVVSISSMFKNATEFNQNLNAWNTTLQTSVNMENVFKGASAFTNGGVALSWNLSSSVDSISDFFSGSGYDTTYTAL